MWSSGFLKETGPGPKEKLVSIILQDRACPRCKVYRQITHTMFLLGVSTPPTLDTSFRFCEIVDHKYNENTFLQYSLRMAGIHKVLSLSKFDFYSVYFNYLNPSWATQASGTG